MKLLFKTDGRNPDTTNLVEEHYDSYEAAIDRIDELYTMNPDNLRQNAGLALFSIVPDDQATNDLVGSNALEKVANYANLLLEDRATPEIKALHKELIQRNISLLAYEFEQGRVSHSTLGIEGVERLLDTKTGTLSDRESMALDWLNEVKPDNRHQGNF